MKSIIGVGGATLICPLSYLFPVTVFLLEKGILDSKRTKISIDHLLIKVFAIYCCIHTANSQPGLSESPN